MMILLVTRMIGVTNRMQKIFELRLFRLSKKRAFGFEVMLLDKGVRGKSIPRRISSM